MSTTKSSRKIVPILVWLILKTLLIHNVRGNYSPSGSSSRANHPHIDGVIQPITESFLPDLHHKYTQETDSLRPFNKRPQEIDAFQSLWTVESEIKSDKMDERPGAIKSLALLKSSFPFSSSWSPESSHGVNNDANDSRSGRRLVSPETMSKNEEGSKIGIVQDGRLFKSWADNEKLLGVYNNTRLLSNSNIGKHQSKMNDTDIFNGLTFKKSGIFSHNRNSKSDLTSYESQLKDNNIIKRNSPLKKRLFFGLNQMNVELMRSQNRKRQARASKEWLRNLLRSHLVSAKLFYRTPKLRTRLVNSRMPSSKLVQETLITDKGMSSSEALLGNISGKPPGSFYPFYTGKGRREDIKTARNFFKGEMFPKSKKHARGKRSSSILSAENTKSRNYNSKHFQSTTIRNGRILNSEGREENQSNNGSSEKKQLSHLVFLTMKTMGLSGESEAFDLEQSGANGTSKSMGKYYKIWIPRGLIVAKPDKSGYEDSTEMSDALLQILSKLSGKPITIEKYTSLHENMDVTGNTGDTYQPAEYDKDKVEKWLPKTSSSDELFLGANWHELERLRYPDVTEGASRNNNNINMLNSSPRQLRISIERRKNRAQQARRTLNHSNASLA